MARKEKILQMLEHDPNDVFLQYALAQEYLSSNQRTEAIQQFKNVIDQFPEYHAAHFQLAQLKTEDGNHTEARQLLNRGIEAAESAGDQHAVSEMTGLLDQIGD